MSLNRLLIFVVLSADLFFVLTCSQQGFPRSGGRPVTVEDAISLTRLADSHYFGGNLPDQVALFSPNRTKFIVVLRNGNLRRNTNEFSILLFRSGGDLSLRNPRLLVRMESSSNRDAIRNPKWLGNHMIAFIGEEAGRSAQIYTLDIASGELSRRTGSPGSIVAYDTTSDGHEIVFAAEPPSRIDREGVHHCPAQIVIEKQYLPDLVAQPCRQPAWDTMQLYVMSGSERPIRLAVSPQDAITSRTTISLSGDGNYALIGAFVRDMPAAWGRYGAGRLNDLFSEKGSGGTSLFVTRYLLFTRNKMHVEPLLDTPMVGGFNQTAWSPNSKSLYIKHVFLPFAGNDSSENALRQTTQFDIEIFLWNKKYRKLSETEWPNVEEHPSNLEITLKEDMNTPPRICATNRKTGQDTVLLDLNPHLREVALGRVELVKWKIEDGTEIQGGLYLPDNVLPAKKYPLIIQLHGFAPQRFSMGGSPADWGSSFAARPLTAAGFVVLQVNVGPDPRADTTEEGAFEMAKIEGGINYLKARGLIDPDKVGLIGFSRGGFDVAYTLTHSDYRFRAAVMADSFYGSYFQYLWFPTKTDFTEIMGSPPYGVGIQSWLENSPSFNLNRVRTPMRLLALEGGPLIFWEWFSLSTQMQYPVEFVWFPNAQHLVVKPKEWVAAVQGNVEWFCFWLKGEENYPPVEPNQYKNWRRLRQQQNMASMDGF